MKDASFRSDDLSSSELASVFDQLLADREAGGTDSISSWCRRFPQWEPILREHADALRLLDEAGRESEPHQAAFEAIPRRLGDFELKREIGRGGMGIVFEAEQTSLRRRVAIKVLAPTGDAGSRDRFRREAEAIARLHQTNIVPIFGLGQHEEIRYYVMQMVAGRGLDDVLDALQRLDSEATTLESLRRQDAFLAEVVSDLLGVALDGLHSPGYWRTVAQLGVQVGRALAHAHAQGVWHRDVKPSNLLLGRGRVLWVTDFGLAKLLDGNDVTQTGEILGTLRYLPPERLHGESGPEGDIYGLGLTLFELLTLTPARQEIERERLLPRVATGELDGLRSRLTGVPTDLATIVLKCVACEVSQRYATAGELVDDLERYLEGRPIRARRAGPLTRLRAWRRRNPLVATLTICLFAALLAGLSGVTGMWWHAEQQRGLAVQSQKTESVLRLDANIAKAEAEHLERQRAEQLVRIMVSRGNERLDAHDPLAALLWYAGALENEPDPSRHWAHHLRLNCTEDRSPRLIHYWHLPDAAGMVRLSPDDRLLAVSDGNWRTDARPGSGSVRVYETESGKPAYPPLQHDAMVRHIEFDATGRYLLSASMDGTARVWKAATGQPAGPPLQHPAPVRHASFSRDSQRIATACDDGNARVWDVEDHRVIRTFEHAEPLRWATLHPSRPILATATSGRSLHTWDLGTGAELHPPCEGAGQMAAFSPNGEYLLSARGVEAATVFRVGDGKPLLPPLADGQHHVPVSFNWHAAFSPDSARVVVAMHGGNATVWDLESGRPLFALPHAMGIWESCFSADGRVIATACDDRTARLWDANTGEPLGGLLHHGRGVCQQCLSHDGALLATVCLDGTVRLWEPTRRTPPLRKFQHASAARQLDWAPDGRRIAVRQHQAVHIHDVRDGTTCLTVAGRAHGNQEAASADQGPDRAFVSEGEFGSPLQNVAFSADGRWLATASVSEQVLVWDANRCELSFAVPKTEGGRFAWSPRSAELLVSNAAGHLRLWDVPQQRPISGTLEHGAPVLRLAVSADGQHLVSAGEDDRVRVWHRDGGLATPCIRQEASLLAVVFHPSGERLLTACGDGTLMPRAARQWDLSSGSAIGSSMPHTDGLTSATYDPRGLYVATGGEDNLVRIWESITGRPLTPALRHWWRPSSVEFSADSQLLLVVDGTARLWDVARGEPIARYDHFDDDGVLYHARLCPVRDVLATAGGDGSVRIWKLPREPRRDAAGWQQLAEMLMAHGIDQAGGLSPVSAANLEERWKTLTPSHATVSRREPSHLTVKNP